MVTKKFTKFETAATATTAIELPKLPTTDSKDSTMTKSKTAILIVVRSLAVMYLYRSVSSFSN